MLCALLLFLSSIAYYTHHVTGQLQLGSPWPMYGRNQLHTSNSPFLMNPLTDGKLRWKLFMGSQIQSSPSIGTDGTIYFGTDAGLVYAVSSTGEVIWKYQTRGAVISTPALSQKDMIFFGSWDKKLYALRASTGVLLWTYEKVFDIIQSSPVIDENNHIYFCAGSNVYALYDTGDLKWKVQIKGISAVSPALSLDGILFLTNVVSTLPFNSLISLYALDGSKYIDPSFFTGDQVSYSSPLVSQ